MKNSEINDWFEKPEFNKGLELLKKYSKNKAYADGLRRKGESRNTMNSLKYDLGKYRTAKSVIIPKEINISPSTEPKTDINLLISTEITKSSVISKNAKLKELISAKNKLFKETVALHHSLEFLEKEEMTRVAKQILLNFDEIDEFWKQIDFFEEHGRFPELKVTEKETKPEKEEIADRAKMVKRQANLRTYISKNNKALKNAKTEKTKDKLIGKINVWQLEYDDLNNKLIK